MGSFPYPRNGVVKLDFEYILLFKKPGNSIKPTQEQKNTAKMTTEEWNTYFTGHWTFPGVRQDKHLAMFPEELPRRLIKMFSFPGETILDPFAGSGTTAKVASDLDRNSISYEINDNFIPLIINKVGDNSLFSELHVAAVNGLPTQNRINSDISRLPYRFKDYCKIEKKIDVKKSQYGSRLDINSPVKREDCYNVKNVISTELILLNNNLT